MGGWWENKSSVPFSIMNALRLCSQCFTDQKRKQQNCETWTMPWSCCKISSNPWKTTFFLHFYFFTSYKVKVLTALFFVEWQQSMRPWEYESMTLWEPVCERMMYFIIFCLLAGNQLYELKSHRRGWWGWGGCPKKSIAFFDYKQWVFSIEMKTKLVHHVESDWMRDWKSARVRECESESVKVREWLLSLDMKTKVVQHVEREWMRECESARVQECESESVKVREWLLSIDMKTKVVQHVESEWIREWESERVREWEWESERVREWESEIVKVREWDCESERVREWQSDRVTEWVRMFWFPAFVWHSDIFFCSKYQNCGHVFWRVHFAYQYKIRTKLKALKMFRNWTSLRHKSQTTHH